MRHISRRHFTSLVAAGGTSILLFSLERCTNFLRDTKYYENLGIQLWSVGELLNDSPEKTLSSLAEIGFKHVELPMFTMVTSIAPMLSEYGLKPTSRHFPFAYATGNWGFFSKYKLPIPEDKSFESVVDDANKYGLKHLVMPNLFLAERGDIDHYKKIAHRLNEIGEICKEAEIQLNYHNHNFEFIPVNGELPFDIIKDETDPELVAFQLDVYFLYLMRLNPAKFIDDLGSRVKLLHLKDLNQRNNTTELISELRNKPPSDLWNETVALGAGLLDFKSILTSAHKNNVENCYVEVEGGQSNYLEVLRQSIQHIKDIGI